jgi:hypothetical protein
MLHFEGRDCTSKNRKNEYWKQNEEFSIPFQSEAYGETLNFRHEFLISQIVTFSWLFERALRVLQTVPGAFPGSSSF